MHTVSAAHLYVRQLMSDAARPFKLSALKGSLVAAAKKCNQQFGRKEEWKHLYFYSARGCTLL